MFNNIVMCRAINGDRLLFGLFTKVSIGPKTLLYFQKIIIMVTNLLQIWMAPECLFEIDLVLA